MKTIAVIASFVIVAFAKPQHPLLQTLKDSKSSQTSRIINGKPAEVAQFPWQVALHPQTPTYSFFCGGTLIHPEWILTAGHCIDGATYFVITLGGITIAGEEDGKIEIHSSTAFLHEEYHPINLNNDIALIKLETPVELSNVIQPITLPVKGDVIGDEQIVRVSGWGKTSDAANEFSNTLNYVDVKTITNDECEDFYIESVINSTICTRGNPNHGICNGDSGGPLIIQRETGDVLIGTVSFVHFTGCESGYPAGYVRTESYLDWIHEKTGIPI